MKRFTETQKWNDPWFRKLTPTEKSFWGWALDYCDAAGVIKIDWDLASFQVGEKIDDTILINFDDKIEKLTDGKYLIINFIEMQYPRGLSKNCKPHMAVFSSIEKHGIKDRLFNLIKGLTNSNKKSNNTNKGLTKSLLSVQDKDKDKEKIKDKERGVGETNDTIIPSNLNDPKFLEIWGEWVSYRKKLKSCKDWNVLFSNQLSILSEWGIEKSVLAIRQSLAGGWQGIFEPKNGILNQGQTQQLLIRNPTEANLMLNDLKNQLENCMTTVTRDEFGNICQPHRAIKPDCIEKSKKIREKIEEIKKLKFE